MKRSHKVNTEKLEVKKQYDERQKRKKRAYYQEEERQLEHCIICLRTMLEHD